MRDNAHRSQNLPQMTRINPQIIQRTQNHALLQKITRRKKRSEFTFVQVKDGRGEELLLPVQELRLRHDRGEKGNLPTADRNVLLLCRCRICANGLQRKKDETGTGREARR